MLIFSVILSFLHSFENLPAIGISVEDSTGLKSCAVLCYDFFPLTITEKKIK